MAGAGVKRSLVSCEKTFMLSKKGCGKFLPVCTSRRLATKFHLLDHSEQIFQALEASLHYMRQYSNSPTKVLRMRIFTRINDA